MRTLTKVVDLTKEEVDQLIDKVIGNIDEYVDREYFSTHTIMYDGRPKDPIIIVTIPDKFTLEMWHGGNRCDINGVRHSIYKPTAYNKLRKAWESTVRIDTDI